MSKEDMFKAELLHEQLNQLEQRLEELSQQHQEIGELIRALETFSSIDTSSETLVSLAPGIFAKGKLMDTHELFVNVGAGTFVKKKPEQVIESVQAQQHQMEAHERELRKQFEQMLQELQALKERFT